MITNISRLTSTELPLPLKPTRHKSQAQEQEEDVQFNQLVHDLKSPVNSLKGIVKLANTQINDEQAKEYFYMINRCVDKLEEKISNTLTMFQSGGEVNNLVEIDFDQLLKEISVSLSHIDGFADTDLQFKIEASMPFYSSKAILESILQNLIENAIKYRCADKDKCTVVVHIADSDNGVQIVVKDNGIGIESKNLPHIFEANFRALMSGEGSHGIGLYLVEKAVEKINGTIEVKSVAGKGTKFTLDLPNCAHDQNYVSLAG